MHSLIQYPDYDKKCKKLCEEKEIRFAGIVDENGKLVAGGFKKGLVPLERDEQRLEEFMRFVSQISLLKSFDDTLGPTCYIAARREKVILISFPFPLSKILLLISAEPTIDIEKLASHIVNIFDRDEARFAER
ncbi:MAG TPA: DUF6659 family protein [Candidatus Nitrosotenuis sp.]|jgi:hypothetical protein|nr:DUF6659 family protein [Candidatus Nitrosotenuis sp.]